MLSARLGQPATQPQSSFHTLKSLIILEGGHTGALASVEVRGQLVVISSLLPLSSSWVSVNTFHNLLSSRDVRCSAAPCTFLKQAQWEYKLRSMSKKEVLNAKHGYT